MCKANRKLEAFRYILTKFVGRQKELTPASSDMEVFSSFSNKRLMKLLYLLCLESVSSDCSDVGLFNIFDNMIAYPNGPVEQDVYDGLRMISGVRCQDGKFIELPCHDNGILKRELYDIIDTAFEKLMNHIGGDSFSNTEYLIDIVHSLYLWPKAYVSSSTGKTMDIAIKDELEKEIKVYKKIFLN